MAISIENSFLYNNLEQKVLERTKELRLEITERKKAEEQIEASLKEKETLLQEIHHRVKNNMQVITSLLKLQARKLTNKAAKDALEESWKRISAMSLIHETLYRSDSMAEIDLKEYLPRLTSYLVKTTRDYKGRINLKVHANDTKLSINQAVPCGLVISELVSNALKHAFPGERKGEILITASANGGDQVNIVVSDNGTGLPEDFDFRSTERMGMSIISSLVERQLDGKLEIKSDNGTRFTITFQREE